MPTSSAKKLPRLPAVLGAEFYILPYSDGLLPVSDEVKFAIAEVIGDCMPSVIVTHHSRSMHKDHVNCHLNVPDAIFYAAIAGFEIRQAAALCKDALLRRKLGG